VNVCEAASNTRLKQFLAAERNIYQKSSKNHLNQKTAFLLNSQAQGVSGKNEQSNETP